MSLRGPRIEVTGSDGTTAHGYATTQDSIPSDSPYYAAGQNHMSISAQDHTTQDTKGTTNPQSPSATQEEKKPSRRKSWLKKWQDLTNPPAEFSDEYVKERTGMTKVELAEWLKDPENKKKAEKLWPSAVYWATL